jgi:general secretion pathway protein G
LIFAISGKKTGLSLVELIMTLSLLSILAALILPSAQMMAKRTKEIELRRNLRVLRNAIDDYSKTQEEACKKNPAGTGCTGIDPVYYPKSLDILVEGQEFSSGVKSETKKFLRKIPCDPFNTDKQKTCKESWGVRALADKECSDRPGDNVFDVCSMSEATAIDGTKYKDW